MLQCIEQFEDSSLDDELTSVAEEVAAVMRHARKVVVIFDEGDSGDRWFLSIEAVVPLSCGREYVDEDHL
jgi:hypothetical protein